MTIDADFQGPVVGTGLIVDFGGSQFDVVETAFREVAGDGITDKAQWLRTIDGVDFRSPIGGDGISIVDRRFDQSQAAIQPRRALVLSPFRRW